LPPRSLPLLTPTLTLRWVLRARRCRLATLVLTVTILNTVRHSPLLAVCAALTGGAAYLQATYVSARYIVHGSPPLSVLPALFDTLFVMFARRWIASSPPRTRTTKTTIRMRRISHINVHVFD
jgi:hypothetical protein